MLGLGGGVFLVPIITLFFGVDEKIAIGASAVAVVTNSVVGSSVHLRSRFTNLRLAMLLQLTMATGALLGATIAVGANPNLLNGPFGAVLLYAAISMALRRQAAPPAPAAGAVDRLQLRALYCDPATDQIVRYTPRRVGLGHCVGGSVRVTSRVVGSVGRKIGRA